MQTKGKRKKATQKTIRLMDKIADKKRIYKDVLNQRYAPMSFGEGSSFGYAESYMIGECPYCKATVDIYDSEYNCEKCEQCLMWEC